MYSKSKFLKYIKGDKFLQAEAERYATMPKEERDFMLQIMFNTYVKGNSVAEALYAKV